MRIIYFSTPRFKAFYPNWSKMVNDLIDLKVARPIAGKIPGIEGLAIDFNHGLRLQIPKGNWHVKVKDYSSKLVLFDNDIQDAILVSAESFYIKWEVEVYLQGHLMLHHIFDCQDRKVHFQFVQTGMGDHLGIFPWIETFRRTHHCKATFTCDSHMKDMFKMLYPNIKWVEKAPSDSYATYYLAPSFHPIITPETFRTVPMDKYGRKMLGGYELADIKYVPDYPRKINEHYVTIAVQASNVPKAWLYPNGWEAVVDYLKSLGYRVICIDLKTENTTHGMTQKMPSNAEDFTGLPLTEVVKLMAHADFFMGVSSGLPWLAHTVGIPVILITVIAPDWFENAPNMYRPINNLVCNSCHNDLRIPWPACYKGCYMYGDTSRAYECTKSIHPQQVIDCIDYLRSKRYKF